MKNQIYVWDKFIRFFHWSLVLAFIIAYLSGEEESAIHIYAGYYILGLLLLRLIWGFIGSKYARFNQFIYSPITMLSYLKRLFTKRGGKRYLGHNPAGGWMVILLMISIFCTSLSGLKVQALEGDGPLAGAAQAVTGQNYFIKVSAYEHEREEYEKSEREEYEKEAYQSNEYKEKENDKIERHGINANEEQWEEIHEFFANLTVLLIVLHIGGVLLSSMKHHENLVRAMLTGYKRP